MAKLLDLAVEIELEKHCDTCAELLGDLGLPDIQGYQLLPMIRGRNDEIPIIVLSSRGDEAGKVQALDLGADDYVTKPFGMDELLGRMRAALRHSTTIMEGLLEALPGLAADPATGAIVLTGGASPSNSDSSALARTSAKQDKALVLEAFDTLSLN